MENTLTNEQAKQEAIKKAYGDKWELVNSLTPKAKSSNDNFDLHYNGAFNSNRLELSMGCVLDIFPDDLFDFDEGYVVPKSIISLQTNNGWIRIEPDGSNLPILMINEKSANKQLYNACYFNENISHIVKTASCISYGFYKDGLTHYKPIKEELKPVY